MEVLAMIGSVCSILSLLISIFVATKVISISNRFSSSAKVDGDGNLVVGRDANVRQK